MSIDYNAVIDILDNFLKLDSNKTEIAGISVSEEYQVKEAIRNLINGYKKQQKQLQEKDKIIDMLADDLYLVDELGEFGDSKEDIIEYFTKKAREV